MPRTTGLFVYGTLRPGGALYKNIKPHVHAHEPARIVGMCLRSFSAFPAMMPYIDHSGYSLNVNQCRDRFPEIHVKGELLTIDESAIAITDRIEGHPGFYHRLMWNVVTDRGTHSRAYAYSFQDAYPHQRRPIVPDGDWFKYEHKLIPHDDEDFFIVEM